MLGSSCTKNPTKFETSFYNCDIKLCIDMQGWGCGGGGVFKQYKPK